MPHRHQDSWLRNGKYVPTFRITTADVSTLENRDKVITLATNKNSDIDSVSFAIVGGADVSKFTLKGNELAIKVTRLLTPILPPPVILTPVGASSTLVTVTARILLMLLIEILSVLVLLPLRQWKAVHMYFQY
jgi:hypothetical protein